LILTCNCNGVLLRDLSFLCGRFEPTIGCRWGELTRAAPQPYSAHSRRKRALVLVFFVLTIPSKMIQHVTIPLSVGIFFTWVIFARQVSDKVARTK
jgi:hypothetical protein